MKDKVFIDTNIFVYSALKDSGSRHDEAVKFLETLKGKAVFISTQVINELYSILEKKYKLNNADIEKEIENIIRFCNVSIITTRTIKLAWVLKKSYKLSYWDSLIAASALGNKCKIIYSEDMHDALVIEEITTIKNPFKWINEHYL